MTPLRQAALAICLAMPFSMALAQSLGPFGPATLSTPIAPPGAGAPSGAKASGTPSPWPSADPRILAPSAGAYANSAGSYGQGAPCSTSLRPGAAQAPMGSCLRWSAIWGGKALFGTRWLRAGDDFPWRTGVKVAAVCRAEVVLDNGERSDMDTPFAPETPSANAPSSRGISCK